MRINDMPEFAALMATLGELYTKTITEILTEIYWNALKHFEFSEVQRAVSQHIADPDDGKFMPKPADIIRYIEGSSEARALQAWTSVISAIQNVGIYNSVVFDDALIHAVIQAMGGWTRMCLMTIDDMSFRANEFQKHYMAFLKYPPDNILPCLSGIFPSSTPVCIVDTRKKQGALERQSTSDDSARNTITLKLLKF